MRVWNNLGPAVVAALLIGCGGGSEDTTLSGYSYSYEADIGPIDVENPGVIHLGVVYGAQHEQLRNQLLRSVGEDAVDDDGVDEGPYLTVSAFILDNGGSNTRNIGLCISDLIGFGVVDNMPCVEQLPAVGEIADELEQITGGTAGAGEMVLFGIPLLTNGDGSLFAEFFATVDGEEVPWADDLQGTLSFNGDLIGYDGPIEADFPDPIVLVDHEPLERLEWNADDYADADSSAIVIVTPPNSTSDSSVVPTGDATGPSLDWETADDGTMFLAWEDRAPGTDDDEQLMRRRVMGLDASGSFELNAEQLGLQAPVDSVAVSLLRVIDHNDQDLDGNTLRLGTMARQDVWVDFFDTDGWTELQEDAQFGDDCGDAEELAPLGPGQYYGSVEDLDDDVDPGREGGVTAGQQYYDEYEWFGSAGRDAIIPIQLDDGDDLTVTFRQAGFDAVMYILDDGCDEDDADNAERVNDNGSRLSEVIEFEGEDDGQIVYLVLDTFSTNSLEFQYPPVDDEVIEGGAFALEIEID